MMSNGSDRLIIWIRNNLKNKLNRGHMNSKQETNSVSKKDSIQTN